ncbi:hypothetical protein FPANT_9817 [Fusarium pseudoanthophilum]|uniref:Uncharacterized protein n=1 Tax=Fusarium pseudoanthophilum TaxID=48495 RepID=A0A8H5KUH3_9HYPO|nr:hypothetical protein FPANT_9817 [Fusarium pseudoanthophilum]
MTSDDGDEEIRVLIEDPDLSPGYPRYVPDDPLEIARRAACLEMLKKGTGEASSMAEAKKTSNEGVQDNGVLVEHPGILDEYSEFCTPRDEPFDPEEDDLLTQGPREGSTKADIVSPRETPKEWLQRLATADFADPSAINNLRLDLIINNVADFDLVTDGEATLTVSPFPGALTVEDTPPKDKDNIYTSYVPSDHDGLLCLEYASQAGILAVYRVDETPIPSATGLPLPSVVLPIGQLQKRYEDKAGIPYSVDTDYVLVIDAVADEHPLWLIFDRKIRSLGEDQVYVKPETVKLAISGTERNFDAAQVLPSVQDWIKS